MFNRMSKNRLLKWLGVADENGKLELSDLEGQATIGTQGSDGDLTISWDESLNEINTVSEHSETRVETIGESPYLFTFDLPTKTIMLNLDDFGLISLEVSKLKKLINLSIQNNLLTNAQANLLYASLPDWSGTETTGTLDVTGGLEFGNTALATAKAWEVIGAIIVEYLATFTATDAGSYWVGTFNGMVERNPDVTLSEDSPISYEAGIVNINDNNYTYLMCQGGSIESIAFQTDALEYLDLNFNQLTTIDVSANTALKYLSLYGNQLTAIDVSNNTALVYLDLSFNQLTAIDVSNNTALEYLDLQINQLTAVDVSANTALKYLSLFGNQLTAIDVSNNTALLELWLTENQLTTLDLSANTNVSFVDIAANLLEDTAIDALFTSLPDRTLTNGGYINVSFNTGTATCDTTIATAKGWTVIADVLT